MKKLFPLFLVLSFTMLWAVPNADITQSEVDQYALTTNSAPAEPVIEKPKADVSIMRPIESFVGTDNIWFDGSGYPPVVLEDTTLLYCPDTSMFSHPVHLPDDGWSAATSDNGSTENYKVWENYAISGEICDIHWWGFMLEYNAGWFECYETAAFDIIFYPDVGGMPDTANPACTYLAVVPTQDTTGFRYHSTLQFPLWRFDVDLLVPCCTLESGWVSIQGASPSTPDCWFLWQSSGTGDGVSWQWDGTAMVNTGYDRGLCLTGTGGAPIGRCCYNNDQDCLDTTEAYCLNVLGGEWDFGLNCIDDPCGCPEDELTIEITTDSWGYEVSWELVDQTTGDTIANVLPNTYGNLTTYVHDICVDSTGCYDFHIHDAYGDGGGPVSIYLNSFLVWYNDGNYGSGTTKYNIGNGCPYVAGMCCYGDFYNPTCIDTSEMACLSTFGGVWSMGMNCIDDGCPSCNFVCPTTSVPEGEPPCSTDYDDVFNGGCNSVPPIFSAYNCGDTVCGETGTFLNQGAQNRDTDWFEFVITEPKAVTFTASVEVPFQILLGYPGSPDPCTGYQFPWSGTANECETLTIDAGILLPGTYWAWVGPSIFSGWPCGAQYWFVVECAYAPLPVIVVSPSSITGEADPGFADYDTITVSNTGDDTLFYSVSAFVNPTVTRFDGTVEPLYEVGDFRVDRQPLGYHPVEDKLRTANPAANLVGEPYFPPMPLSVGGPDAFGYTWIDSDELGGPTYGWVDISGVGTVISLGDDSNLGPFALGFPFNYYGSVFTDIRVASNGFATFTSTSGSLSNVAIPTSSEPNNLLAIFWDDLAPHNAGTVYYYADATNNRFIISYDGVPHYSVTGSLYFQIIINADGTIIYQYDVMNHAGHLVSATVGIENGDGTIGLQYDYNTNPFPPHDYLAILFEPPTFWLTTDITSGTIAPAGAPDLVEVTMDALELTAGIYTGRVVINYNDLLNPSVEVPVTFIVGGTGTVAGQVTDANDASPIEGAVVTATLVSATVVEDTTDASGNYSIDITPGNVNVNVEADGYTTDSQDVTVVENQTTTHNVALTAPIALIDTSPVVDTVAIGDTMVYTRTISNNGTAPLEYTVVLNTNVGPQVMIHRSPVTERIANIVDPMGQTDAAPFSFSFNPPAILAQGDTLFSMDLAYLGDTQLLGIEFDGTYYWITGGFSGGEPNKLYQLDATGVLINTYDQSSLAGWGWRDLAWDGSYLWASDQAMIQEIDPATGLVTGNTIPGPVNPCRALAYDPVNDWFWTASFSSSIYAFDRTGTTQGTFGNTYSVYGMAWDDVSDDGPWLWVFSQDGTPQYTIWQFDPVGGTYTGLSYVGILPAGFTAGLAGGCGITTDLPGYGDFAVFVALIQGTPNDFMQGYEIAPYSTWFTVQSGGSGTVSPDDSADIEFLVDFRDSLIVEDSTYQAVATVNTNDPYPPEWNPQILFSITAGGGGGCDYVVGDVNGSDSYNGLDITFGVAFFKGGPDPMCDSCDCPPHPFFWVCGDVNASCSYNGLDITYGVSYFKGGPGPMPCPDCPPAGGPASEIKRPTETPQVIKSKTANQKGIDLK